MTYSLLKHIIFIVNMTNLLVTKAVSVGTCLRDCLYTVYIPSKRIICKQPNSQTARIFTTILDIYIQIVKLVVLFTYQPLLHNAAYLELKQNFRLVCQNSIYYNP